MLPVPPLPVLLPLLPPRLWHVLVTGGSRAAGAVGPASSAAAGRGVLRTWMLMCLLSTLNSLMHPLPMLCLPARL
jgi:hypothetical protein